jgi:hypothetical protein
LKKQRDAFGLSLFDSSLNIHTQCRSSTSHYRLLLTYLDQLIHDKTPQKKTFATDALHQVADSVHRRSLILVFSDMFDTSENSDKLFAALQHLKHNKHEVVLFHTVDKALEVDFEYENRPYEFIDMESGEKVKLQSNQVKEFYQKKLKGFTDDLKAKCLQYKIDLVEADIQKGFHPILQSYLVKRTKMNV